MDSAAVASEAGRVVFIGHTAALGGAELGLIDMAAHFGGAAEVCLFEEGPLGQALQKRGVRVQVLPASRATLSVRRESGPMAALRAAADVFKLARGIARWTGPRDVIYANTQKAWIVTAFVGLFWRRTVVWHLHDILSPQHFGRLMRKLGPFLANRSAAAVIVNSRATANSFVAQGGRRELVHLVYNGIDETPFGALHGTDRTALRRRLGLGDAIIVGLFGRIAPWKGQHVFLEALKDLPQVEAVIVGDTLFGENAYLDTLRRRVQDPDLSGRVRFLGHRNDVPALMHAVDIVAHTSVDAEPFGRVIVEGMLAGRPVVAAATGGAREIIEDGVDGLLVTPRNPQALARAISGLLSNPSRAQALAEAGHEKARRQFSARNMLSGIEAALSGLTARVR